MQKNGWVLAFEDSSSSYAAGPMTSNHIMRSIAAPQKITVSLYSQHNLQIPCKEL